MKSIMKESISLMPHERLIMRIIEGRKGQDHAITAEKMAIMTGMNVRFVRMVIKNLIENHGYPIAASNTAPFGYFWPITKEEIRQYKATLIHRISSLANRLRAFDRITADRIAKTLDLFA